MSKKRTSVESSNDEQTKEDGSVSIFQEVDDAKRAKLEPMYDTTLQDLPIEILERILVKAVAMEVNGLKVTRCVQKKQANLVIRRLRTVCPQWNCVLTTDIFTKEVHRLLEGQERIVFEILDQPTFRVKVLKLTTLKDEIFLLCSPLDGSTMFVNVYDRNNMTEVKDVIPLPGIFPGDMAACSVANCVYILNTERYRPSIYRITKNEEHHFEVSPWLNNLSLPVASQGLISVSLNGNLIILSSQQNPKSAFYECNPKPDEPACVRIFNANGNLKHELMLSPDIYGFRIINTVIQKSDGNLVLLAANDENNAKLMEIDTKGRILRQYQSSLRAYSVMSFADVYGRILVTDYRNRIELFDREFSQLKIADPRPAEDFICSTPQIHFNSDRNEMVRIEMFKYMYDGSYHFIEDTVLSIFRMRNE